MARLNEAHRVLSDPTDREQYDREVDDLVTAAFLRGPVVVEWQPPARAEAFYQPPIGWSRPDHRTVVVGSGNRVDLAAVAGSGVRAVAVLNANRARVGDDDLLDLTRACPDLESLNLTGTLVTDAGMAHLLALAGLSSLSLSGTAITDASLEVLAHVTTLVELELIDTAVTDAGMAGMGSLAALSVLLLRGTRVTATGLSALDSCPLHLVALPAHIHRAEKKRLIAVHPDIHLV
jgi:hypothetical protein